MILTVSFWIGTIFVAMIFMVITMIATTNAAPVFIAAVFRDIFILNLFFVIMYLVSRPTRKLTSQKFSSTAEEKPGLGVSSSTATRITLEDGARVHSSKRDSMPAKEDV